MLEQIVMVSGKQGSGKTTLCNALIDYYGRRPDWSVFHLTFAKVLYDIHNLVLKEMKFYNVNLPHPEKDGYLLQLLGTDWGRKRIGENVWVDIVKNVIKDLIDTRRKFKEESNMLIVISDCRFENEFDAFPEALRVRLECSEETRKARVSMWRETTEHPSETGLDNYADQGKFDLYLNTDSVDQAGCLSLTQVKLEKNSWIERRSI